ncbi:uncharacterized protein EI90DRAFT_3065450 [Cantharellus anzutake]|uniref:uncharacterized protein n=1 Tax=Cantharellus anzutake TaxID=1750568 RepID=UPI00190870BF|nr:uncharacterized protein EI90DRAFT_3065450 [Cantharellus anzutake]KAF8328063.1 hypothetical protein EI90DRAFT_3065450 [Cantharellus anzutake]
MELGIARQRHCTTWLHNIPAWPALAVQWVLLFIMRFSLFLRFCFGTRNGCLTPTKGGNNLGGAKKKVPTNCED